MQSWLTLADVWPWALGGGMLLFVILLAVAALVITVWALVDAIRNPALDDVMKIVWVLVILFLGPPLGAIIYLIVGRSMGRRSAI